MKPITRRRIIDGIVFIVTYLMLDNAGAGYWALLILPFGLWNYYDGATRHELFE